MSENGVQRKMFGCQNNVALHDLLHTEYRYGDQIKEIDWTCGMYGRKQYIQCFSE